MLFPCPREACKSSLQGVSVGPSRAEPLKAVTGAGLVAANPAGWCYRGHCHEEQG